MGKLTVVSFVTLDGVIQAPGGPDEDPESGFRHGGWQAPFLDDASGRHITEGIERQDAMLLGRKTYDIFADYWPNMPDDDPIGRAFNRMPKYVATRTLERPAWKNTTVVGRDLADEVGRIKNEHDRIQVFGSADLVRSLLHHGLVDALDLFLHPVVLGTGKRLLPEGMDATRFRLAASQTYGTGVVRLIYHPDGTPEYGTIGAQEQRASRQPAPVEDAREAHGA